jgi:transcriptional regulator PpsR
MHDPPPPATSDLAVFSPLADELARTVVNLDGDIALVMDAAGVIQRVACSDAERPTLDVHRWIGRHWADTVSGETRAKVLRMLDDLARTGSARRRQVNHPPNATSDGADVPVLYAAVRLGAEGPVLAVGRDLRSHAALQQRFVRVQAEIERGYWRQRQAALPLERLYHAAYDAVVLVDAAARSIVVANAPALRLCAQPPPATSGQPVEALFDAHSHAAIAALLASAAAGAPGEIRARAALDRTVLAVSAARLTGGQLLLRARVADESSHEREPAFAALIDPAGDAVVVTDDAGRVLAANPAFVGLVRAAHESQVLGRPLADWLAHDGPLHRQLGLAAAAGVAPAMPAELRAIGGLGVAVEFGAVRIDDAEPPSIGVVLHRRGQAVPPVAPPEALRAAFEKLLRQLGRTPLDELLRETRAQAEAVLMRAALDRCSGDPVLAAEMLGVGQGDYNRRARRHGLTRIP